MDLFNDASLVFEHKENLKKDENVDLEYAVYRMRILAKFIGLWPSFSEHYTTFKAIIQKIKIFILYAMLLFLTIPNFLYVCIEERILFRRIQMMSAVTMNFMTLSKYTILLRRRDKISEIVKTVEDDWRTIERNPVLCSIMKKSIDTGHSMANVCTGFHLTASIFFRIIKPLLAPVIITATGRIIRALPLPIYRGPLKIDYSASPNYEIIFAMQAISNVVAVSTIITTFGFAAIFITHACGQMDIVMAMMDKMIDGDVGNGKEKVVTPEDGFKDRLETVVKLHLKILKFVSRIEDLMSEIFLVEITGGTFALCLSGYYFIMGLGRHNAIRIFTYFVMVSSLTAQLYTYCYIGDLLTEKSAKIGSKVYSLDWHRLTGKQGLLILLIIRATRNPVRITAGKMLVLSLYNFGGIMKSAAGYLNLLRTIATAE